MLGFNGVGEWTTTAIGVGEGADLALLEEILSISVCFIVHSRVSRLKVNSGEYKLMVLLLTVNRAMLILSASI